MRWGLGPVSWFGQLAKLFNRLGRAFSLGELTTNGPVLLFCGDALRLPLTWLFL